MPVLLLQAARAPRLPLSPSEQAQPGTPRSPLWSAIGDRAGHTQFHFGALHGVAPELERGPDPFGALAHPGQAPVAGTGTRGEDRRIDPAAIVADAQSQLVDAIGQLYLDPAGLRMIGGVGNGLAGDAEDLVARQRVERACPPLDDDPEVGGGRARE